MSNYFSRQRFLLSGLLFAGAGALAACGQGNSTPDTVREGQRLRRRYA